MGVLCKNNWQAIFKNTILRYVTLLFRWCLKSPFISLFYYLFLLLFSTHGPTLYVATFARSLWKPILHFVLKAVCLQTYCSLQHAPVLKHPTWGVSMHFKLWIYRQVQNNYTHLILFFLHTATNLILHWSSSKFGRLQERFMILLDCACAWVLEKERKRWRRVVCVCSCVCGSVW